MWARQLSSQEKEHRLKDVRLLRTHLSSLLNPHTPVCRGAPQDGRLENYIAIEVPNKDGYAVLGLTDQGWKRQLIEYRFKESMGVDDSTLAVIGQHEFNPGMLARGTVRQWADFVSRTLYGPPHIALGAALQSVVYRNPRAEENVRTHLETIYDRFVGSGEWAFIDPTMRERYATTDTRGLWDPRIAKALFNLGRLQVSATEEIDRLGSRNAGNDSTTFINQILG